ncbi:MAG TPA: PQQ-binding-like beta-propeller repeat protein [Polyangiaceae bacterium]|nr:PQQ-binding-like beta-propeller repeat protein [Polyangiaceae bacterium]
MRAGAFGRSAPRAAGALGRALLGAAGAFGRGAALAAAALALSGCIGGQTRLGSVFSRKWLEDDSGERLERLVGDLQYVPVEPGADVAVGALPGLLVGAPLDGGVAWRFEHPLDARPFIAGRVVVGVGGGELFCLRASNGERLWARPVGGMRLLGAGDDGRTTVAAFASRAGVGHVLLAVDRDGTVLRQLETEEPLGRPAVIGSIAFLPWGQRFVTAYDLTHGEDVARVALPTDASHALTLGGALYFGERGLARFDAALVRAGARAPALFLPKHEIWGAMPWLRPAAEPRGLVAERADKVRVYARPAPYGRPAGYDDDAAYATYSRLAFGLRPSTGALRWVYAHDEVIVGGAAFAGGFALCDASGRVLLLEREGGLVASMRRLGAAVGSCVVQADALRREPSGRPPPPFADQAALALLVNDPELAPAQRFLLRELAASPSAESTALLLDLAVHPLRSDALEGDFDAALAARRDGAAHLIEALLPSFEGIRGVLRRPPFGALADALAGMGAADAAGPLASRLNDPALPSPVTRRIAAALDALATPAERDELEAFFTLNRCAADDDPPLAAAVVVAARALLRVGGARADELVTYALHDPLTSTPVRDGLLALLGAAPPAAPPKAAERPGRPGQRNETPTLQ